MLKIRSRKAFTLLELVVVLVVLAILAAIAIPTYAAVIQDAKNQVAIAGATSVGTDAVALGAIGQTGATAATFLTAAGELTPAVTPGTETTYTDGNLETAEITIPNQPCVTVSFADGVNVAPTAVATCA
jgi:prepilin-type N-terminal cleavage/methylation domain-containing protein